ncbi:hypothetical protein BDV93DRAFT_552562 [Ceratobasidium sp. AG-I]|nr:hypothetical protein BDV93DRAFT_552562 [Ceratobasidium sp. AG-I]
MSQPVRSEYPGTAFFAVHRGHKTGVFATHAELLKHIDGYNHPKWCVFPNKAHATLFARTGEIPPGANPIKPGDYQRSPVKRTMSMGGSAGRLTAANSLASAGPSTSGVGPSRTASTSAATTTFKLPAPPAKATAIRHHSPSRAGRPTTGTSTTTMLGAQRSSSTLAESNQRQHSMSSTVSTVPTLGLNQSRSSSTTSISTSSAVSALDGSIEVWTDGSCLGNGKPGARAAYAVYFAPNDPRNESGRVPGQQTNNRGELLAVIRALEIIDEDAPMLTVYTDSKYTIQCVTDPNWLPKWIAKGGLNGSNKPAANYSMVRYLDALLNCRGDRVALVHVKAHQTNVGNNAVDKLARDAAGSIAEIPASSPDWDAKRIQLERRPKASVKGKPFVRSVNSLADIPVAAAPSYTKPAVTTTVAPTTPSVTPKKPLVQGSLARILKKSAPIEDQGSDYGYSDLDIDIDDIDDPESPPPPAVASTSRVTIEGRTPAPKASGPGKRVRDEPMDVDGEEIADSETERRARVRAGKKKQRVRCPNCQHKFCP